MKNQEKQLFKALCSFNEDTFDEDLLTYATPEVLGKLFFNRMQAVAYGCLRKHNILGKVNREFRNCLKGAYDQNVRKNQSYIRCVQWLQDVLVAYGCKYAVLKGALLCRLYPEGYRTSNDIDLLVLPEDVTLIGSALLNEGFQQGYIRNDVFIPATRREIIESKMMRGETVPYIKPVNLPGMDYLEVDINFSLDYKSGNTDILGMMLNCAQDVSISGGELRTLCMEDFLIHLCCHLYKEATTLPWVQMQRDMTLYKYCDIYLLFYHMTLAKVDSLFERAHQFGLEKVCAFAVLQAAALFKFKSQDAVSIASAVLEKDPDFMHTIVDPTRKNTWIYKERDIGKRFFTDSRRDLLVEVDDNE